MDVINGTTYKSLSRKRPLNNQRLRRNKQDVFNRLYEGKTPVKNPPKLKHIKRSSDFEGEKARREQIPEKEDKDALSTSDSKTDPMDSETNLPEEIDTEDEGNSNKTLTDPIETVNDIDRNAVQEIPQPLEIKHESTPPEKNLIPTEQPPQCNGSDMTHPCEVTQDINTIVSSKQCDGTSKISSSSSEKSCLPSSEFSSQSWNSLPKLAGKYGRELTKTLLSALPQGSDLDKDTCDNDKEHEDPHFYDVRVKTRHVQYENSTLAIRKTSNSQSSTEKTTLKTSVKKSLGTWMSRSKDLLGGVYQNLPSYMSPQNSTMKQIPPSLPVAPEPALPVPETPPSEDDVEEVNTISVYSSFFPECVCCIDQVQKCKCPLVTSEYADMDDLIDTEKNRMWWTITGNFGNILPIDWSKTYTRQKYLPALNLNERQKGGNRNSSGPPSSNASPRTNDDDDQVAQDLDMHQLILSGPPQDQEPIKSADEVIQEIDDIMQEGSSSEDEGIEDGSSSTKASEPSLSSLPPPLYHDKLKDLNTTQLNEILMELEMTIRQYSETLISQLALRDELEYEKELKNTFISLLLQVQNKRRMFNVEKKRPKKTLGGNGMDPKYLTTVIPYDIRHKTPDNQTVQILIKILTAINEDSPTVPTLLTDYILKVLCPS